MRWVCAGPVGPTPPPLPEPAYDRSELGHRCGNGSQAHGLRHNWALSSDHGDERVDLQLLDQSEDRTQQRLQLSDYCPLLWSAWLGHLTQGIENGELKEQLNHAVVALIHGGSGSVAKHSHPRTAWFLQPTWRIM